MAAAKTPYQISESRFERDNNRDLLEWAWADDIVTFGVYTKFLLLAAWKETEYHGVNLERGELLTNQTEISKDCGLTRQQVRTVLLSDKARHNIKIKEYLTEKIDIVEKERIRPVRVTDRDFDEDAIKIYRALYLDGDIRPTSRQIGDKFAYGKRAVFSKRDYAISSLAVCSPSSSETLSQSPTATDSVCPSPTAALCVRSRSISDSISQITNSFCVMLLRCR